MFQLHFLDQQNLAPRNPGNVLICFNGFSTCKMGQKVILEKNPKLFPFHIRAKSFNSSKSCLFPQSDWIRENCASQMDRVRENYNSQIQNLKDIRQYGSSQLSAVRGQYYEQVIFVSLTGPIMLVLET